MIEGIKKAEYQAPALVEYGSVRNLTGGSTGSVDDGVAGMRMK